MFNIPTIYIQHCAGQPGTYNNDNNSKICWLSRSTEGKCPKLKLKLHTEGSCLMLLLGPGKSRISQKLH